MGLTCTTREPDAWAGSIHEQEAREEPPRCAFCDACEVSAEGEYCSDQCFALAIEEERADRATTEMMLAEVTP